MKTLPALGAEALAQPRGARTVEKRKVPDTLSLMSRVTVDAESVPFQAEKVTVEETPGQGASPDGRSRRWDSHRAARRDELTHAARKAIHHGGPELSMDEIASAIGTSKSIVYRYFSDRGGLQTAVGEAVLRDLGSALAEVSHQAGDPHEAVRAMVEVYLEMISTSPSVYAFVTRGGDVADATTPMRTLAHDAAELLAPVFADVLGSNGHSRALAQTWAAGVIGFVRGSAEVWLHVDPETRLDLPDLTDAITAWICEGTRA